MSIPRLSIGTSDFAALRKPGVLLVDKTELISRLLDDPYQTLLFPRPRRFGKSTNLGVYSLLKQDYATDFGFTEAEVEDLRSRLRSPLQMEDLRRWYNGYDFGGQVIYNPWSLLSALAHPREPLQPYWVNTASDELIRELLFRFGGGGDAMEALLSGQGVRKVIRESTVLRDIYQEQGALWSFLLFTGYLKAQDVRVEELSETHTQITGLLKVPNLEVGTVFSNLFASWLRRGESGEDSLKALGQALLSGDLAHFQERLQRILVESSSFHDVGGKRVKMPPEHVYQVFILGLLVSMSPRYRVTANREGGHGRYDVMVMPREAGQPGAVLELKVKARGGTLERALAAAKKQLLTKDYAAELRALGAAPIQQVAVAFDGKRVLVGHATDPAPKRRSA